MERLIDLNCDQPTGEIFPKAKSIRPLRIFVQTLTFHKSRYY